MTGRKVLENQKCKGTFFDDGFLQKVHRQGQNYWSNTEGFPRQSKKETDTHCTVFIQQPSSWTKARKERKP
jgi:hypothetical protein